MFKKGHAKTGGRKKGSKNKGSINKLDEIEAACEGLGLKPIDLLLELCQSKDEHIKLGAVKELCSYVYAKKKAVEVIAEVGGRSHEDNEGNPKEDPIIVEIRERFKKA